jgi:serine/threonine-protein kinase
VPPYSNDDVTAEHVTRAGTTGVSSVATSLTSPFAPGSIVAGRYRLVALLGRGGMGEVYRADDLTLGLPVVLKFLPERISVGDPRLPQFHNELRVARQVSHKNVCRLYDLGESDGRRFLTMEYVDGEDELRGRDTSGLSLWHHQRAALPRLEKSRSATCRAALLQRAQADRLEL